MECRVAVFECGKMINDHEYVPAVHEETKEEEVLNDAVAFHVNVSINRTLYASGFSIDKSEI